MNYLATSRFLSIYIKSKLAQGIYRFRYYPILDNYNIISRRLISSA
jgi:hypothetical protein